MSMTITKTHRYSIGQSVRFSSGIVRAKEITVDNQPVWISIVDQMAQPGLTAPISSP